jgi:hypothetical protein
MQTHVHDLGDLVRVSGTFSDADSGDAIDPDVVKVSIKSPDDTVTTYVYGVDTEVVKDATGEYHADIDANDAGVWFYRWWSTGDGQAAEESRFVVRDAAAV